MTIELGDEGIRAIFYVAWDGMDWLATVRIGASGAEAEYRFRHYRDEKVFGSADRKSWHTIQREPHIQRNDAQDVATLITLMSDTCREMKRMGGKAWELIRGEHSLEEFADMFTQLPFVHARIVNISDCEKRRRVTNGHLTVCLLHKPTGKTASAEGPEEQAKEIEAKAFERLAKSF